MNRKLRAYNSEIKRLKRLPAERRRSQLSVLLDTAFSWSTGAGGLQLR
jgi:hypothetical protein